MNLNKALTWFINVWVGLVVSLNVAAIIGFMSIAPTVWAGLGKIQEVYSPFNIWNWLVEILSLSPALVAMWWRERRRAASNSAITKPAELAPAGLFSRIFDAALPGTGPKDNAQNESKRTQIAVMALWVAISGGMAVYRTLSIDPVGSNGYKCRFDRIGEPLVSEGDRKKLDPQFYAPGMDPFSRYDPDIVGELTEESFCKQSSAQAIYDLRLHPLASILGSLFPTVVLAPFAYWLSGFGLLRYKARIAKIKSRFKTCEFCAETIKAEATACRYCGRDIKTS